MTPTPMPPTPIPTLLPSLLDLWRPTPAWLDALSQADLEGGPGPWLPRLLDRALVYPGAGLDFSPIRQSLGAVHSFLFFDYGTPLETVRSALVEAYPAWRLLGLQAFDPRTLLRAVPQAFRFQEPNAHQQHSDFGLWALCEGPDGARFSLIYAALEAVEAIASLFPERAPTGLVIQEHGLGGNCWHEGFGTKLEALGERCWGGPPDFVLHGNPWHRPWKGVLTERGEDVAFEAMHRNVREVWRREAIVAETADGGWNF